MDKNDRQIAAVLLTAAVIAFLFFVVAVYAVHVDHQEMQACLKAGHEWVSGDCAARLK